METQKEGISKFKEAFNEYYKLKGRYDNQIEKEIAKIRSNQNFSNKEKQDKFKSIKFRCINCGKEGGTIFEQKGNFLSVKCGNAKNKCKLDIKLERADYSNLYKEIDFFDFKINKNKINIIKSKLDLLFGFSNEKETLNIFNKLKLELTEEVKLYKKYNDLFLEIAHNFSKDNEIQKLNTKLISSIQNFNNLLKEFQETGNISYLKEAIELYIYSISITANNIRNLTYTYNAVEKNEDENIYFLIQERFTQDQLQIPIKGTQDKVISFKK